MDAMSKIIYKVGSFGAPFISKCLPIFYEHVIYELRE